MELKVTRGFAIFAVVVLSVQPVAAKSPQLSTAELCEVLQPCLTPAQYASGPFVEKPVIKLVTFRQVQSICGSGGQHGDAVGDDAILGCAQLTGMGCIVHVPRDIKAKSPQIFDLILAHELAHCRGWVHARY